MCNYGTKRDTSDVRRERSNVDGYSWTDYAENEGTRRCFNKGIIEKRICDAYNENLEESNYEDSQWD